MTKTEKMTYAKALTAVLNGDVLTDEIREKLENLLAQQTKKADAERKPTKNQRENERLRTVIVDFLSAHRGEDFTCEEIAANVEDCNGFSTSKVSALMRPLIKGKTVAKAIKDKKVRYSIA